MAHYLLHLGTNDGDPSRIQENPRAYLKKMRDAAGATNGRLDAIWFTEDGSAIVAIFQSADPADVPAFREAVAGDDIEQQLTITRLLTMRELSPIVGEESPAEESRARMDAVDLGSDLSFPASDPPSWLWEYGNTPNKSPE